MAPVRVDEVCGEQGHRVADDVARGDAPQARSAIRAGHDLFPLAGGEERQRVRLGPGQNPLEILHVLVGDPPDDISTFPEDGTLSCVGGRHAVLRAGVEPNAVAEHGDARRGEVHRGDNKIRLDHVIDVHLGLGNPVPAAVPRVHREPEAVPIGARAELRAQLVLPGPPVQLSPETPFNVGFVDRRADLVHAGAFDRIPVLKHIVDDAERPVAGKQFHIVDMAHGQQAAVAGQVGGVDTSAVLQGLLSLFQQLQQLRRVGELGQIASATWNLVVQHHHLPTPLATGLDAAEGVQVIRGSTKHAAQAQLERGGEGHQLRVIGKDDRRDEYPQRFGLQLVHQRDVRPHRRVRFPALRTPATVADVVLVFALRRRNNAAAGAHLEPRSRILRTGDAHSRTAPVEQPEVEPSDPDLAAELGAEGVLTQLPRIADVLRSDIGAGGDLERGPLAFLVLVAETRFIEGREGRNAAERDHIEPLPGVRCVITVTPEACPRGVIRIGPAAGGAATPPLDQAVVHAAHIDRVDAHRSPAGVESRTRSKFPQRGPTTALVPAVLDLCLRGFLVDPP